tara:strand:- start:204 stop:410 length:207 start_codon:yes stop_codon:yes gene_type:complete
MMSRTALGTSLALPLLRIESTYHEPVIGSKILVLLAVHKCMKEQYWKVDNSPRITYKESKKDEPNNNQ